MGQDWNLVNVDKLRAFGYWGKMGEFFWDERPGVIDRLSTPVNPAEWPCLFTTGRPNSHAFDKVAYRTLASDCQKFRFEYLRFRLQRRSWAGSRIICLGDYARDLPQGLLSEEEMEKLEENADEMEEEGEDITDVSLLNRSLMVYQAQAASPWAGEELISSTRSRLTFRHKGFWEATPVARAWLSLDLKDFTLRRAQSTSPEDRWMLRNLTKKEFVIKSKGGTSEGFTQVLLSLISWSDDPSVSMVCDEADAEQLIRGPWAGDRIDVTLYSLHEQKKNTGWKNVTDEVLKLVKRLAEEEDGMGYRFLETLPF
ncbi:hypothetical protein BDP27DRAFT_1416955 [Rhodocollybia butyracea]|uniref:Uncharacterized protein n=1 Tax=Rhodocollybia butyracea TaxID=206335 RepID=A0A9P5Q387_9AGAR|nr:hypothetical protein BDP27DRAFT_1416955 [Rhodocollybia butyracea]